MIIDSERIFVYFFIFSILNVHVTIIIIFFSLVIFFDKEDNNNNDHFYNILSEIMTIDLFKLLSIQTNKAKQSKEEKMKIKATKMKIESLEPNNFLFNFKVAYNVFFVLLVDNLKLTIFFFSIIFPMFLVFPGCFRVFQTKEKEKFQRKKDYNKHDDKTLMEPNWKTTKNSKTRTKLEKVIDFGIDWRFWK